MIFFPLLFLLFWVFSTLVVYFFGPVSYFGANNDLVVALVLFFCFMGVVGYFSGLGISKRLFFNTSQYIFKVNFYIFSFLTLLSTLIFNEVLVKSGSLFPSNYFLIFDGFSSLGDLYYSSKSESSGYSGSVFFSFLFGVLGPFRYFYIPYLVLNWPNIGFVKRIIGCMLVFLPVMSGVSIGTNKPIFDSALITAISFFICWIYAKKFKDSQLEYFCRKGLKVGLVFVIFSVIIFGYAMNGRGVTFEYIESNSPRGDILVSSDIEESGISVSLVMLSHYIVQGYYGLNLAIGAGFDSTYGLGHSPFLLRQYEKISGESLSKNTYQEKIDSDWASGVRWPSAFTFYANDVSFLGVPFVGFFQMMIFGICWYLGVYKGMREMIYSLPLHFQQVIFLPANNQVFLFADGFFAANYILFALLLRMVVKGVKNAG